MKKSYIHNVKYGVVENLMGPKSMKGMKHHFLVIVYRKASMVSKLSFILKAFFRSKVFRNRQ